MHITKITLTLIFGLAFAVPSILAAERPESSWVREGADGRLVYRTTENGDRIPDFSHCGYMSGGVALPRVPVVIELAPSGNGTDDSPQIQRAIDELGQKPRNENGFRGAILLKVGEWIISSPIRIGHSGIVLRGEGEQTVLHARGFEDMRSRVFNIGGEGSWQEVSGTRQAVETDRLPLGERALPVGNPRHFSVGDTVIVRINRNDEWVRALGMDRLPPRRDGGRVAQWNPRGYSLSYDRTIIEVGDNSVTLDIALGEAIDTRFNDAVIYKYDFSGRIEQVGIENLKAIAEFKGRPDDQREDHAWTFIRLEAVQNSWIRDITTRHFAFGLLSSSATVKWVTVQDSRCLDPVSQLRGSRRYGFSIGGQLMLVQRCYANDDRHGFAYGARVPGPNVFLDCLAEKSHGDTGPHHRWATAGLMDNVRVPDHSIRVQNRLHMGSGHGWAGANFVTWNSKADHFMIHAPAIANNWAIGLVGEKRAPAFADPGFYERFTHPSHIEEHGLDQPSAWGFDDHADRGWEAHGTPVEPVSLYLRQLSDRLGPQAIANIRDQPYSFFPR